MCSQTAVSFDSSLDWEQNVAPVDGHHQHPHVALLCPITNGKTITFPLDLSTMRPNPLKKRHICAIIVLNVLLAGVLQRQ